jgi:hypothetical protein
MRRMLCLALCALAALPAAGPAHGAAEVAPADCGSKELTFLFWPKGNPTISSIPLYSQRRPNLVVYSGAGSPSVGRVLAEVIAEAHEIHPFLFEGALCHDARPSRRSTVLRSARTAKPATIVCRFPKSPVLDVDKLAAGRYRLRAFVPGKGLVLDARIEQGGSAVSFATAYCTSSAPPRN